MNTIDQQANRRILIIDDNRAIHEDFRKILGAESGLHAVQAVHSGIFGDSAMPVTRAGFELASAYQGAEGLEMVRRASGEDKPYAMAFVDKDSKISVIFLINFIRWNLKIKKKHIDKGLSVKMSLTLFGVFKLKKRIPSI